MCEPTSEIITIYGKNACSFTTKAVNLARDMGYNYRYFDMTPHSAEYVKQFFSGYVPPAHTTWPVVFVGNMFIGGYAEFDSWACTQPSRCNPCSNPAPRGSTRKPRKPECNPCSTPAPRRSRRRSVQKKVECDPCSTPVPRRSARLNSVRKSICRGEKMTPTQRLREQCKQCGIRGYGSMRKYKMEQALGMY